MAIVGAEVLQGTNMKYFTLLFSFVR